jgi:cytoskeleton protein RodZ
MNTATTIDSGSQYLDDKPGAQLALMRNKKGYTTDYVAGKLHLRVHLIELLEADDYSKMPEPVFIKGYLRAYAKLIEVSPDPFIETFNRCYREERKVERALWQSRKQSHKAENTIRWVTSLIAVVVLTAVVMWWNKNKDEQIKLPTTVSQTEVKIQAPDSEIRLTDLSKMRSLLSSVSQLVPVDVPSE